MEELWDALEFDNQDPEEIREVIADNQTIQALLSDSYIQLSKKQTPNLLAQIGKHQVLILADSGSIGTFVSDKLVHSLHLDTEHCEPSTFRIADGNNMCCSTTVP
jgi:hypothetical protein